MQDYLKLYLNIETMTIVLKLLTDFPYCPKGDKESVMLSSGEHVRSM